jgi:hypothetical protein
MDEKAVSDAAYFISYDSETQITGFAMKMDDFGAHRFGRTAWILRTERACTDIWDDLVSFRDSKGTLFMVQIFPRRAVWSIPQSFAHDPIEELLMGLEPYVGEK